MTWDVGSSASTVAVSSASLATIQATAPATGSVGRPSDSSYLMTYSGSEWLYTFRGSQAFLPTLGAWTDENLDGSSTYTADGGAIVGSFADTGTTLTYQTVSHALTEGQTHILGFYVDSGVNGTGAANSIFHCGFYESATGKSVSVRISSAAGVLDVVRRATIDGLVAETAYTEEAEPHYQRGSLLFIRLVWASDVLSYSIAPTARGPWKVLVPSEPEATYFTTLPDKVVWGFANRDGKQAAHVLFSHEIA